MALADEMTAFSEAVLAGGTDLLEGGRVVEKPGMYYVFEGTEEEEGKHTPSKLNPNYS